MTKQNSSPPSVQEMGVRILNNLARVKGYIEILKLEIDTPDKIGPGASKHDWLEATNTLEQSLNELDRYLRANNLDADHE